MKVKINTHKIDSLSPEDALPLLVKIKRFLLGKQKPDRFTRFIFTLNLIGWSLFFVWNTLSYTAVRLSDFIKANKGFSVNAIIRRQGREYGFAGQDFLDSLHVYLFLQFFILMIILVGLFFMYRKRTIYIVFYFGGFLLHFLVLFLLLGSQYFIEDITFFDKIVYGGMLLSVFIHSALMNDEKIDDRKFIRFFQRK